MADTRNAVTEVQALLQNRLDELDDEKRRLERALQSLAPTPKRSSRRQAQGKGRTRNAQAPGRGAKATRRRRSRVSRDQREAELIKLAHAEPSASNAKLAKELGVSSSYVSSLLKELRAEGRLSRKDGGHRH